jgi:hypothetical protein
MHASLLDTKALAVACLLGLGATASSAACAPRHQVVLADDSRACVTDYAIAREQPPGLPTTLANATPGTGLYHVAVPDNVDSCPRVLGFASTNQHLNAAGPVGAPPDARAAQALRECSAAVRAASTGTTCNCILLIEDGRSALTREQFVQLAERRSSLVAAKPETAGGPVAKPPAPPLPSIATPPPTTENPPSPQTRVSERRLTARALVIGNAAYKTLGVLTNTIGDAQAIANKLRSFGIDVDLVLDANRAEMVLALARYHVNATAYDVNLFYYAGHGLQIGGINYLIPVDLSLSGVSVGAVKLNAISLNDTLEYLPARTRVVFLDACRDNPIARALATTRGAAPAGLAGIDSPSGTLIAYSTKDGFAAEDGAGPNSPYTTALLAHLGDPDDIAIVLRRVRQAVLKATNNRQQPWEYGSLIGDALVLSRLAR